MRYSSDLEDEGGMNQEENQNFRDKAEVMNTQPGMGRWTCIKLNSYMGGTAS